jgi:two-component system nitrogen regulation sensor histidine kinase NtrY
MNLFENALEAMHYSGKIRVVSKLLSDQNLAVIEIIDEGSGIHPDDMDKLFLPYFSKKKTGTGLGLAIVHRIITDHHGTIRIENNLPIGTKVIIELPVTG